MRKKTISLILTILFLSACSGPLAKNEMTEYRDVVPGQEEEEKSMDKKEETPFAKRYLEKAGHEDLAAEYKYAVIKTSLGDIKVEFFEEESPITVNNFMNLAKKGFYAGTKFHRVIEDFMIQGGDPLSKDDDRSNDGRGGPGYQFADEFNDIPLTKGNLAMANSGPNTNGSQFFIVTAEATSWLDGKHTNFGKVVEGMDTVEKIEGLEVDSRDNPLQEVSIEEVELIK